MSEEVGERFPEVADWVDTEHTKRRWAGEQHGTGEPEVVSTGLPGGVEGWGSGPRGRGGPWPNRAGAVAFGEGFGI